MTPFDASALLAILLAFYQPASEANLARAFSERPEYFAGGELIGTHHDALRLPDGTIWDLIFAVDGPEAPHYQVILPSGSSDAGGDPLFGLVAGPLRPIRLDVLPIVPAGDVFAPIVADALGDAPATDDVIGRAADTIREAVDPASLEAVYADTIGGASDALDQELGGLDAARPDDVIDQTDGQARRAGAFESDYDDGEPGDMDTSRAGLPPEDAPAHQPGSGDAVQIPPFDPGSAGGEWAKPGPLEEV